MFESLYNQAIQFYRDDRNIRLYHDERHIQNMLWAWETKNLPMMLEDRLLGAIAILYHDAVYDPTRHDNEEQSATLMEELLGGYLTDRQIDWIKGAILATKHLDAPSTVYPEYNWIRDIDLLILAGSAPEYKRYLWKIRREYGTFEDNVFMQGRLDFLNRFVSRPRIFLTNEFSPLEPLARTNLEHERDRLLAGEFIYD